MFFSLLVTLRSSFLPSNVIVKFSRVVDAGGGGALNTSVKNSLLSTNVLLSLGTRHARYCGRNTNITYQTASLSMTLSYLKVISDIANFFT